MAKESVVSTIQILFGDVAYEMSSLTAACILVFSLLYTPCIAAISSIKREMGAKWAVAVVCWQCLFAWIVTVLVNVIGGLF